MNKTAITLGFFLLVFLGIVGGVAILLLAPGGLDRFISLMVTVLAIASTAAITFYGMGKQGDAIQAQGEQIETIQHQTNGNTSALLNEVARLNTLLALAPAVVVPAVLPTGLSRHAAEDPAADTV